MNADDVLNALEKAMQEHGVPNDVINLFSNQVYGKLEELLPVITEKWNQAKEQIMVMLNQVADNFSGNVKEIRNAIDDFGGIEKVAVMLWNMEERTEGVITFEEVLKWLKQNLNPTVHSGGCLYVSETKTLAKDYHVCFLDKNNKPMMDYKEKHLIVHAAKCDVAIAEQLGNKNMIIFK